MIYGDTPEFTDKHTARRYALKLQGEQLAHTLSLGNSITIEDTIRVSTKMDNEYNKMIYHFKLMKKDYIDLLNIITKNIQKWA